jgi:hypothetical protein
VISLHLLHVRIRRLEQPISRRAFVRKLKIVTNLRQRSELPRWLRLNPWSVENVWALLTVLLQARRIRQAVPMATQPNLSTGN